MSAPVRRQATPLFGDDEDGAGKESAVDLVAGEGVGEGAGVDIDLDAGVEDWLIDDIGDGLEDKPEYGKNGLREVGEFGGVSALGGDEWELNTF